MASPTPAASPSKHAKVQVEDPWHDMETEVDVATRNMLNVREQYRQALEKVGAGADGAPKATGAKDWTQISASAAQQVDSLLSSLAQHLSAIEPDVLVMQESITAALEHPDKYNVPTAELQRRKDVVQSFMRKIAKGKSDVTHGMKLRERRMELLKEQAAKRQAGGGDGPANHGPGGDINSYMKQEYEAQREMHAQHDAALERIHGGVLSAEQKAKVINKELVDQEKMLNDVEHDMNGVQMKMENAMVRIGKMLDATSDKGKIGIIIALLIILTIIVVFLFTGNDASASAS